MAKNLVELMQEMDELKKDKRITIEYLRDKISIINRNPNALTIKEMEFLLTELVDHLEIGTDLQYLNYGERKSLA